MRKFQRPWYFFLKIAKTLNSNLVDIQVNATNIGTGGTLLQRAVRLEKMQQVEFLVDPYGLYGAQPTVVPDGEVDDDLGNISPLSIAIKKNNYEMWALLRYHMGDATDLQYLEQMFDIIEWVGPSAAKSTKDYDDFKNGFKELLLPYTSLQEVSCSSNFINIFLENVFNTIELHQ